MKNEDKNWRESDYFHWLLELVGADDQDYYPLFRKLHDIEFTWSVANDDNRAADGVNLRYDYISEENLRLDSCGLDLNRPCSVLEMLIGLSVRIERDVIGEPGNDQTAKWFWIMIENLSLDRQHVSYFDPKFVDEIVQKMLKRDYEKDGFGCLFPPEKQDEKQDLRLKKQEIWYQMSYYLEEHFS